MSPSGVRSESVPVGPFRKVAEHADLTIAAVRLGWFTRNGAPDTPRVRRVLGMKPYSPGHRRAPRVREYMSKEMAEQMCRALGKDPWEMGL